MRPKPAATAASTAPAPKPLVTARTTTSRPPARLIRSSTAARRSRRACGVGPPRRGGAASLEEGGDVEVVLALERIGLLPGEEVLHRGDVRILVLVAAGPLGGLRGRVPPVEPGRDDRHADLVAELVVDHGAED